MSRSESKPSASAERGSHRLHQLASFIQHELGVLLPREVELSEGMLLTVTKVVVVDDLSVARVGVSVLPFARRHEAFATLAAARGELQRQVAARLATWRVPKLEFYLDETPERAATIEGLLDHLNTLEAKPEDTRRLDSLRQGG